MPEYAPGTPSWVELSSPNTDAAAEFYGQLMGWSATEPGGDETGGYRMFQQDGKNIAGLMGHMQEGQPTAWVTYISVADAEETAAKVKAAGGTVMIEPMDVTDIGQDGDLRRSHRRGVRCLAAEELHRRRSRQRAGLALLERGAHPRRRRGQGVLPGRLRVGSWPPVV